MFSPSRCFQVAYKVPGAMQADWVDLYNRLYRERILFLGQQVAIVRRRGWKKGSVL